MAIIRDADGATGLKVDSTSRAARVGLYDPTTGLPMVSFIRGPGADFDTGAGVTTLDLFGMAVPGPGGPQVAGTAAVPLRTDPTGTTTQPVSISAPVTIGSMPAVTGAVDANLRVNGNPVATGNRVPVTASGTVSIDNLPTTQQVAGSVSVTNQPTSTAVNNFPATQQVAGTVAVNNHPTAITVNNPNNAPVPVSIQDGLDAALEFVATLEVAPAATLADAAVLWALRNGGSKTIYVRRIDLQQGFSGTAAASRSTWELRRFSGTITGGTAVTPAKKVNSSAASVASVLQATAALTVSGVTFDAGAIHRQASPNQLTAISTQDITFTGGPIALAPGEGLAIRSVGTTNILGGYLVGSLGWYEI